MEPHDSILDRAALDSLVRFGGEKLLREMASLFISSVPPRLREARAAAVAGDIKGVGRSLHSLKSSAGQLGAKVMWERCTRGEAQAASGRSDGLAEIVAEAELAFNAACAALQAETPGLNAAVA